MAQQTRPRERPNENAIQSLGCPLPDETPVGSHRAWVCPLCHLRSSQNDESAFKRHLDQLHKDELDAKITSSSTDATTWRDELVSRAFAAPTHSA